MLLDWLLIPLPLLLLAAEPASGVREDSDGREELSVSPTTALVMQMLGSVSRLSLLNRRRIGSLQSRNELSDVELVVGGVSRFHRWSDEPLVMDAWTIFSPSSFPQTSSSSGRLSRRDEGKKGSVIDL
jgi:hypothetical protein